MIRRLAIRNYRIFRQLDLEFSDGINVLVGPNDIGKSTLLEAISLALTGRLAGKPFAYELSPYHVNNAATRAYSDSLRTGRAATPPEIIIELYLSPDCGAEALRGTNNLSGEDAIGVRLQAQLAPEFHDEYSAFVATVRDGALVPTEYYRVDWTAFSGQSITSRSVPIDVSIVDPAALRLQNGIDTHLQQIISAQLQPSERVELSREYRSLRETFAERKSVQEINKKLQGDSGLLTNRALSLGVDISQRFTWERGLVAHVDELPFHLISRGEQSAIKTVLALGQRARDCHVVLIEEPEAHLSYTKLRSLLERIADQCRGQQVIIATHSNFVLNKVGLEHLVLLGPEGPLRMTDLPDGTVDYFKKLAGYDTLRMVLARASILVEGPSDELVVQRAYRDKHGRLPIEDDVDVISVGLAHKRFLDIAVRIGKPVRVVVDNDAKPVSNHQTRFQEYLIKPNVELCVGDGAGGRTLETQIVAANDLELLNKVLGQKFTSSDELLDFMLKNKTEAALAIFQSEDVIDMPPYISRAIAHV
ncbi:ATP-dependent nuclease [Lysobacter claricitrinus]|uniref:ATP-dependent nuclease n=1 Tax=Lysobacter claricitrinus TaxID=3367728 RepID=UPI0037DB4A16